MEKNKYLKGTRKKISKMSEISKKGKIIKKQIMKKNDEIDVIINENFRTRLHLTYKDGIKPEGILKVSNVRGTVETNNKKSGDREITWYCNYVDNAGRIFYGEHMTNDYGPEPEMKWRPWQQQLLEELNTEPDDRKIIWYCDYRGNTGKSFFAKHMFTYRGALMSTSTNIYNVAKMLQKHSEKGKTKKVVIFDYFRCVEAKARKVGEALEYLKDGFVMGGRYKAETLTFPSPHVVILTNYLPDISRCSLNRWYIRILDKKKWNNT